MKKRFFVLTIFILTIIITAEVIISAYLYTNPISENRINTITKTTYISTKADVDLEYAKLDQVQKQPENVSKLFVSGWIPDWDIPDGLASLKANEGTFNGVAPVWFYLQADGTLKETPYTNGPELTDYVKTKKLELVPSIALFDADTLSSVLNSPEKTDANINQILDYVFKNNYNGIDLDYESTFLADKELFYNYLSKLSQRLHEQHKILSFTALPKWGDYIEYPTLPQTRRAQDYKRIADLVDEFRIMTYDFYGRTSSQAGPVAPLQWMEYVIKYAISQGVPRDKILLGIPTYSYDWSDRPIAKTIDIINWTGNLTPNTLETGSAYFNLQVDQVRTKYGLTEKFNDEWGEAIGTYTFEGKNRIIVFPTEKSFALRKQLAADYGLKGISYWRLGDEDGLRL